jgi:hypothetical protein
MGEHGDTLVVIGVDEEHVLLVEQNAALLDEELPVQRVETVDGVRAQVDLLVVGLSGCGRDFGLGGCRRLTRSRHGRSMPRDR